MAEILQDPAANAAVVVVIVVVVRARPQAVPLAITTMRKSTHGFPFLSYMGMGLRVEGWGGGGGGWGGGRRFSPINKDETVDDYLKTSWLFSLLARLNANVTS